MEGKIFNLLKKIYISLIVAFIGFFIILNILFTLKLIKLQQRTLTLIPKNHRIVEIYDQLHQDCFADMNKFTLNLLTGYRNISIRTSKQLKENRIIIGEVFFNSHTEFSDEAWRAIFAHELSHKKIEYNEEESRLQIEMMVDREASKCVGKKAMRGALTKILEIDKESRNQENKKRIKKLE